MKILFISGDSDNRIHAREWKVAKRTNIDWDEEFELCLKHYRRNGHYVPTVFGEFDERRIHTIEFNGYLGFITGEESD